MLFLLAIEDWYVDIKYFINSLDYYAYIALVAALAISIVAIFRYVVKYAFNVNVIKKNVITPIVLCIILFALLIALTTLRTV